MVGQVDSKRHLLRRLKVGKSKNVLTYRPVLFVAGHREQLETCINKIEENGAIFYKCSLCGKTTPRKDALKTHVENIHFPGSYQCHHCDQMFNSKITRNVHVGRKHKFN